MRRAKSRNGVNPNTIFGSGSGRSGGFGRIHKAETKISLENQVKLKEIEALREQLSTIEFDKRKTEAELIKLGNFLKNNRTLYSYRIIFNFFHT